MKIFIYKTAIVAVVTLIVFEIIIGSKIKSIKREISQISSEQNRKKIINKIREEIGKANKKENYLNEKDKILLSTFIKKIGKELKLEN